MKFFSYESRFSQILIKLSYSCWLNTLWLLCSLPIITIGASTAALYSVTLKIVNDREASITKQFFDNFKRNFAQATRLWLIALFLGLFLAADIYIVTRLRLSATGGIAVMWTLILALIIVATVIYTITLIYLFPLIAYYENTDIAMIKNSFLFGVRYLFSTILVFAIHLAMFYVVVNLFTPFVIFGEGLCAMFSSFLFIQIFLLNSYQNEKDEEE